MVTIDKSTVREIAFIGSSAIGDTIMRTIPFCRWLRKVFPDARITLITGNLAGNVLLQHCPYIDEKILMEDGVLGKAKLMMKLLKTRYDIIFDLYPSQASSTLIKHLRKRESICYSPSPYEKAFTMPLPYSKDHFESIMHQDLAVLQQLDPTYEPHYSIEVFADEDESLSQNIPTHEWEKKIVIHLWGMERDMASGRNPRCRTNDRWIDLLNRIRKGHQIALIFIGAKDNIAPVQEVIDWLDNKEHIYDFAGKSNIPQTLGLVKSADIMLCTDSGPMHFGLVYHKPIVGLWGKIAPDFDFFVSNPLRYDDVMDISVDDAYNEIKKVL